MNRKLISKTCGQGGCGPDWGLAFGLCNLGPKKRQLPITAKFHVLKNGKKVKTLDTMSKVLEPTERSERKKRWRE